MLRSRSFVAVLLLAAAATVTACSSAPDDAPTGLGEQLELDTGTKWVVYVEPSSNEVRFLSPIDPVRIGSGTNEEDARAFFDRHRDQLHGTGKADELRVVEASASPDGTTHVRFDHYLPGTSLPVFDVSSTAHFTADGRAYWLRPGFRADLSGVGSVPAIAQGEAVSAATAHLVATCGPMNGAPQVETAELGVRAVDGQPASLAYRVRAEVDAEHCVAPEVLVDALTGRIKNMHERARSAFELAAGARHYIFTAEADLKWVDVKTHWIAKPNLKSNASPFVETKRYGGKGDNVEDIEKSSDGWDTHVNKGVAVSAHFWGYHALRFFGEAKLCKAGTASRCVDQQIVVHDTAKRTDSGMNAANIGGTVYLGDGDAFGSGNQMPAAAAFDVVAHEIAHGFVQRTSKLLGSREPGALDESFADVMGASAEEWFNETNDVLHPKMHNLVFGEHWTKDGSGKRDMVDPGSKTHADDTHGHKEADPDHTRKVVKCRADEEPSQVSTDGCFVHRNAGIPNRAFSLMTIGGTNKTSKISVAKGIGWPAAREIWFKSITSLSAGADFKQAALAQMAEAALRGPAVVQAVGCAWLGVGVLDLTGNTDPRTALLACPSAGPPPAPSPAPTPSGASSCAGRGDAVVCSELALASAYICKNGGIVAPALCADLAQHCKKAGPNDWTGALVDGQLVCE